MQRVLGSTAFWMLLVLIVLVLVFGALSRDWTMLRFSNFQNMALSASVVMLLAVGMTFILGAGELDLSIGANVMLSSVVAAKVMTAVAGTFDEVRLGVYPNLGPGIVAEWSPASQPAPRSDSSTAWLRLDFVSARSSSRSRPWGWERAWPSC